MLVRSGTTLVKFWFSVSRKEQIARFTIRRIDPVRQWKLSPMDLASLDRWDDYTAAKEAMFQHTHTTHAPWTVVRSNDKKRGRVEAIRFVLNRLDYPDKDLISSAGPTHSSSGRRPSSLQTPVKRQATNRVGTVPQPVEDPPAVISSSKRRRRRARSCRARPPAARQPSSSSSCLWH